MKPIECEFEADVLAAVWSDDLRIHVQSCAVCSEVAAIAAAMGDAREEMRSAAIIPDAGRVWWLAQMRARREAAKAAGRPITAVQVMALACAVGLLGACFGATSLWFQAALSRIQSTAPAFMAQHGLLVLAMAAVLLLLPGAVYLALGKE